MNCFNKGTYRCGWLIMTLLVLLNPVKAQNAPEWTVNPGDFQFSMTLVASVRVDNVLSEDANDQIAVFVNDELRGTGKLTIAVPSSGARVAFIQVYSNTVNGEALSFKIYDASEDLVIAAVNAEVFEDGKKLGGNQTPYEISNNTSPGSIQLSTDAFDENLGSGTVVATLSNDDPDESETHTYTLVEGDGDDNNNQFLIEDAGLQTAVVFDYEDLSSLSLRVQVADNKGATHTQILTLSVNDVNDAPTAINLDNSTIDENESTNALVGSLSSSDQDLSDSHTYSLVAGEGDGENALFQIDGSSLLSKGVFDFETLADLNIRIRSTDTAGDFYEQSFTIQVNDINDAPSGLSLSAVTLEENTGNNAFVADLSTEDPDTGDSHTYSFAEGEGDDDNTLFTLRNNGELYAIEDFDFETKEQYNIRLLATDSEGAAFSQSFEINIMDANEAPSEILLSNSSIDENSADGTIIGNLSSSDPDAGDAHQYTLIAGAGDEGNNAFLINEDGQLAVSRAFDFEQQASYSIRIQSIDAGGLSLAQVFVIEVVDVNEGSTVIALSDNQLEENNSIGGTIGSFSTTDPDNAETFTYSLVAGEGDTDNASFEIEGSTLKAAASFDHESKSDYNIRVRSTDSQSNELESVFTITIQDVNETPTALNLSNNTIDENGEEGTFIGNFSTTDVDAGDAFVYSFVNGDGDADNELFTIQNGDELFATTSFDFEAKAGYNIRIKTTDQEGANLETSFVLSVSDINDAPTGIALTQSTVDENNAISDVIGTFSTTDQDAGDTHVYSLTAGTGDENNDSFTINNNGELLAGEAFDFERQSSYNVRVTSTDAAGATFATSLTISINDVNEGSTVIALSNNQLAENNTIGASVGTLSTTDPDNAETFTYSLVAGDGDTGNGSFEIDGNIVKASETFNHEAQSEYSIRIKSRDSQSNELESVFSITIQDLNETPTALNLSNDIVDENGAESTSIGSLSSIDVDDGDTFVYSFTEGDGDTDNELFTIQNGDELFTTTSFDFETRSSYAVRIKTTDQEGASVEANFIVNVSDVNDTPTAIALSQSSVDENNAISDVIGTFSSTDQDAGDTHTYSLAPGSGDEDNSSFTINNNGELVAGEAFDFELQSRYSIRVTTTDAANAVFDTSFIVTINDVNEESTVIALSNNQLAENNALGDGIGTLNTTDPDNEETFTYALVAGEGDIDNASFEVDGSTLKAAKVFNYEEKNTYSIRVRSTAASAGAIESTFTIDIEDRNDAPMAVSLSGQSVVENNTSDELIGELSTEDQDATDTHIYSLSAGNGDTHNDFFAIRNTNELVLTESADFETNEQLMVRVVTIDNAGARLESAFVIDVGNLPEPVFSSPSSIMFETTEIGGASEQTFTIANTGPDGNLEITGASLTGPFSTEITTAQIGAGQSVSFQVTFSPTERGELTGTLTLQTNVGEQSVSLTGTGELVTGIEDLPDFSRKVSVYPNPARNRITIDPSVFRGKRLRIHMIDASGNQIFYKEENPTSEELSITVSTMNPGIYLLVLSDGKQVARKKVIIE